MKVEHEDNRTRGKFYVEENGEQVAELAYHKKDEGQINLYHTEVDESLRGKGVGKDMLQAAAQFARENHLKILPTCPFAKGVMEGSPEYADVVAGQ
jgi:predicted GNAT family acetyltransferase